MVTVDTNQYPQVKEKSQIYMGLPLAFVVQPEIKLYALLSDLSPDTPWGERKMAAQKLGNMRYPEALPALLDALPVDPFWMVRCAIIQALEKIGDQRAIPTLRKVAEEDGFQVVRSHAAKAIKRLS